MSQFNRRGGKVFDTVVIRERIPTKFSSEIITLLVGPESYKILAHLDVLCRSRYFSTALTGPFKESREKLMTFPEETEIEAFTALIEFLYSADFTPRTIAHQSLILAPALDPMWYSPRDPECIRHTVSKLVRTYALAHKYGIPDCGDLVMEKFRLMRNDPWAPGDAVNAALFAYEEVPESEGKLRPFLLERVKEVLKRGEGREEVRAAVLENCELAWDLVDALRGNVVELIGRLPSVGTFLPQGQEYKQNHGGPFLPAGRNRG
ncbi:hypothetical protein RUND412_006223 [Rhizina undulata]